MANVNGNPGIAIDPRSGWRPKVGENLLDSSEGRKAVLNDLWETDPTEFEGKEIAVLNLLCAPGIKGAESLDVRRYLKRLDALTAHVKSEMDRNIDKLPKDPNYWYCPQKWKAAWVATVIKKYHHISYNPVIARAKDQGIHLPMDNARDIFINGVLDDDPRRRHGTCASLPVLLTAVGRRLGFPIKLVTAGRHVFARWEGDGARFNIEISCPGGMACPPDEEFLRYTKHDKDPKYEKSSFHLRNLTPAEEFALFMSFRSEALFYAERYAETFIWSARSLQFSPDDPGFIHWATRSTHPELKRRWKAANPGKELEGADLDFNVTPHLAAHELPLYLTITAHMNEWWGDLKEARTRFEGACRSNFHGNNEQRDLQRFLKKHGLGRNPEPFLPPDNFPWRFQLKCEPHKRPHTLMQLAHEFEAKGEYVKARDALHDLYMYDPGHSGVFARARMIEKMPAFQEQLLSLIAERKKALSFRN